MVEEPKHMIKLFLFLLEQGFLTEEQIYKIAPINRGQLLHLVEAGYIEIKKSYFDSRELYLPTKKAYFSLRSRGVRVSSNYLKKQPLKSELHEIRLTDIRLVFEELGYSHWKSERRLQNEDLYHVRPDGLLSFSGRKIAIELQLSHGRSEHGYFERFGFYEGHSSINAVLYLVASPELKKRLMRLSEGRTKIYFVLLRDFIEYKQSANIQHIEFNRDVRLSEFLEVIKERGRFISKPQERIVAIQ